MADPTCHNCPEGKRVERYDHPCHDSASGQITHYVHVARCQECGNQTVNDEPAESPNMTRSFEETVSGGERVTRKSRRGEPIGPPAGAIRGA